jgi:hypothetical protein
VEVGNIIDYSTKKRWTTNLQCWQLVNDYWTKITGSKAWMWDTLTSKQNAIRNIWESDWPIVGWVMVSNPLNNSVWHTWIVQKVNDDGSVVILEANAAGKKEGQPPVLKTYTAEQMKWMMFSIPPKWSSYTKTSSSSWVRNNEWYILNVPWFDKLSPEKQKQIKWMSDEWLATYIENNTKDNTSDFTKEEKEILNAWNFITTIASWDWNFWFNKDDAKAVWENISSMISNWYTVNDVTDFLSQFVNEEKSMYYKDWKVYFKNTWLDNWYTIQELIRLTQKK